MHGLDGAVFLMFTQIAITIIKKKKKKKMKKRVYHWFLYQNKKNT